MNVLMEGIPKGFEYSEVENIFMKIEGVVKVHNLRIWALSLDKTALSAHLAISESIFGLSLHFFHLKKILFIFTLIIFIFSTDPGASPQHILRTATRNIHDRYNFFEMTLQIEEFNEKMENCKQCKSLQ